MAVELSAESVAAVGVLLAGMGTAIGMLWRALRRDVGQLIARIRQLEDARAQDAQRHAEEYRALCERQLIAQGHMVTVLREVLAVLRARPCTADQGTTPRPHNLPTVDTETLIPRGAA